AAFRLDTPTARRIYIDPWLDNPKCPQGERNPERIDAILLTHGHGDHANGTPELAQRFDCPVYAQVELRGWLDRQGVADDGTQAFNKGGTIELDDVRVTMTDARHSSSAPDGAYTGESTGLVLRFDDAPTIYFAGDTNVFGDMELIRRLYEPDVAVLPIGDHFTMGPEEAALALELLGTTRCIPSHYGTFPLLRGTPAELRRLAPDVDVIAPEPGETVEL
ncbi:MAG: metal-dependent hydrolase, partial [Actinobacteria bacterium]|nr:metal-dependent hydrolase [Actinomycetota bacterium]